MTKFRLPFVLALTVVLAVGWVSTARADDTGEFDGKTHVDFTPYLWVPTINGTFGFTLSQINSSIPVAADLTKTFDLRSGPNNYLTKLNFALMGTFQLRQGNLSLYSDVINLNASNVSTTVTDLSGPAGNLNVAIGVNAGAQIVSTLWTFGAGYTLYHHQGTNVDFLVGGRMAYLSANANLQLTSSGPLGQTFSAGTAAKETDWNFILGAKGQIGLGPKFSIPYYADFGPETLYTWQGLVGLKYGNLSLDWRHLSYSNASPGAFVKQFSLDGPALAYTLHIW